MSTRMFHFCFTHLWDSCKNKFYSKEECRQEVFPLILMSFFYETMHSSSTRPPIASRVKGDEDKFVATSKPIDDPYTFVSHSVHFKLENSINECYFFINKFQQPLNLRWRCVSTFFIPGSLLKCSFLITELFYIVNSESIELIFTLNLFSLVKTPQIGNDASAKILSRRKRKEKEEVARVLFP